MSADTTKQGQRFDFADAKVNLEVRGRIGEEWEDGPQTLAMVNRTSKTGRYAELPVATHSIIKAEDMSINNLPAYNVKLTAKQVAEVQKWCELNPETSIHGTLLHTCWPLDFQSTGQPRTGNNCILVGDPYDGDYNFASAVVKAYKTKTHMSVAEWTDKFGIKVRGRCFRSSGRIMVDDPEFERSAPSPEVVNKKRRLEAKLANKHPTSMADSKSVARLQDEVNNLKAQHAEELALVKANAQFEKECLNSQLQQAEKELDEVKSTTQGNIAAFNKSIELVRQFSDINEHFMTPLFKAAESLKPYFEEAKYSAEAQELAVEAHSQLRRQTMIHMQWRLRRKASKLHNPRLYARYLWYLKNKPFTVNGAIPDNILLTFCGDDDSDETIEEMALPDFPSDDLIPEVVQDAEDQSQELLTAPTPTGQPATTTGAA